MTAFAQSPMPLACKRFVWRYDSLARTKGKTDSAPLTSMEKYTLSVDYKSAFSVRYLLS